MTTILKDEPLLTASLVMIFMLLLFGGFIALIIFLVIHARKKAEEARRQAQLWAAARGWQHYARDDNLRHRWRMPLFQSGSGRRTHNVLTGPTNSKSGVVRQALSFEYEYTVSTGKSSTTYYHHVVAVFLPNYIPTLTIAPEGVGAKLAKMFGGQDIQFESEEFNRRWRITGNNLAFAHAVVHPQTMEYLMRYAPHNVAYYLLGDALLIYTSGRQNLANIDQMVWHITDLIDLVPEFVWHDYQLRPYR